MHGHGGTPPMNPIGLIQFVFLSEYYRRREAIRQAILDRTGHPRVQRALKRLAKQVLTHRLRPTS